MPDYKNDPAAFVRDFIPEFHPMPRYQSRLFRSLVERARRITLGDRPAPSFQGSQGKPGLADYMGGDQATQVIHWSNAPGSKVAPDMGAPVFAGVGPDGAVYAHVPRAPHDRAEDSLESLIREVSGLQSGDILDQSEADAVAEVCKRAEAMFDMLSSARETLSPSGFSSAAKFDLWRSLTACIAAAEGKPKGGA